MQYFRGGVSSNGEVGIFEVPGNWTVLWNLNLRVPLWVLRVVGSESDLFSVAVPMTVFDVSGVRRVWLFPNSTTSEGTIVLCVDDVIQGRTTVSTRKSLSGPFFLPSQFSPSQILFLPRLQYPEPLRIVERRLAVLVGTGTHRRKTCGLLLLLYADDLIPLDIIVTSTLYDTHAVVYITIRYRRIQEPQILMRSFDRRDSL